MRVEFFYDVGSPYSYLASTQVGALASRTGAEVLWRPLLLGAVVKATDGHPPIETPAKARALGRDLYRWANAYGVPFVFPSTFPQNTLRMMRAIVAADAAARVPLSSAAFRAMWVQDRDVSDAATIAAIARDVGLDGEALLEATGTQAVKDALRAQTDEAVARGTFGVPTFFVEDELYWGNDRLAHVEAHLLGRKL